MLFLSKKICRLQVPGALFLEQIQIPPKFVSGNVFVDATLELKQKTGFYCPFFLRSIRSHFNRDFLPDNSSEIADYELSTIRKHLANNPAYLVAHPSPVIHFNRLRPKGITVTINLDVVETITRYNVSYWQRLGTIWIQYLSIFIVLWKLIGVLKDYLFTNQLIHAWEIIPWKKMY